jgi:hypothetical protein
MIRTATLIAAATLVALAAAPAGATTTRHLQQPTAQQVVMASEGGCEAFNQAITQAVATQIRTGKHAEARRLMGLFRICGR